MAAKKDANKSMDDFSISLSEGMGEEDSRLM